MQHEINRVREFHQKHGFTLDQELNQPVEQSPDGCACTLAALNQLALQNFKNALEVMAKTLERGCLVIDGFPPTPFDIRLLRAHLHLEETAELLDGLIHRDEVRVLDALADTSFITNGTALTFGLPLAEAYHEVCDSNMTKAVRDPGDTRLRNKGASYIPPDIAGVIEEHRIYRDGTEV